MLIGIYQLEPRARNGSDEKMQAFIKLKLNSNKRLVLKFYFCSFVSFCDETLFSL